MSFALDLSKFADKTSKRADQIVRKIILDCARSVVRMSPVDTGRFKGNWDYGYEIAPLAQFTTDDKSGAVSLSRIEGKLGDMAGHQHFIANNLPYAMALENGHSQVQAPHGMVKLTAIKFQSIVDEAAGAV